MEQAIILELRGALERERKAYQLYILLVKKTEIASLQNIFQMLAMEELKHEEFIKKALNLGDLLKAKEYIIKKHIPIDELLDFKPDSSYSKIVESVMLAIQKENASIHLYKKLKEKVNNVAHYQALNEFFDFMINEEIEHQHILTILLNKIKYN